MANLGKTSFKGEWTREERMKEEIDTAIESLRKAVKIGSEVRFRTLTHVERGLLRDAQMALEGLRQT